MKTNRAVSLACCLVVRGVKKPRRWGSGVRRGLVTVVMPQCHMNVMATALLASWFRSLCLFGNIGEGPPGMWRARPFKKTAPAGRLEPVHASGF
jgi:hypothetical protein